MRLFTITMTIFILLFAMQSLQFCALLPVQYLDISIFFQVVTAQNGIIKNVLEYLEHPIYSHNLTHFI